MVPFRREKTVSHCAASIAPAANPASPRGRNHEGNLALGRTPAGRSRVAKPSLPWPRKMETIFWGARFGAISAANIPVDE